MNANRPGPVWRPVQLFGQVRAHNVLIGYAYRRMFRSLAQRQREAEWMDSPSADPDQLRQSLAFIRRINTALGYTRATLRHLDRFSRDWNRSQPMSPMRILDVATGSGDV